MATSSKKNGSKTQGKAKVQEQVLPEDEVSLMIPPCINQDEAAVDLTGLITTAEGKKSLVVDKEGRLRPSSP